jgi:homoserine dehydrogenase
MNKLHILHLGVGNVGKELITQIAAQEKNITQKYAIEIVYSGLFTSASGFFSRNGISPREALEYIEQKKLSEGLDSRQAIEEIPVPFICIDTTASEETAPILKRALERGGFAVFSNKKPLSGKQADFDELHQIAGNSRLFYETVVGAGLPVIQTLKNFLDTGDEILEIQGCFSGTLGFLFSQMDNAVPFSKAVLEAKARGFTEPDPRDDLSGLDVARKALILARLLGQKLELDDIKLENLYPKEMGNYSIEEFLKKLPRLDKQYSQKISSAAKENKVLRFIARIDKKDCAVGLQAVDSNSDIGSLKGPDNLIVFRTKRYFDNPLIIKGPGAGIEVTAAGVFSDIISIIKIIK